MKIDKKESGIYAIKNLIDGKLYIGSAISLKKRTRYHINRLTANRHVNKHLQSAWNKHGKENFTIIILQRGVMPQKLIAREQYWLDFYLSYNSTHGYNKCPVAGSNLGSKYTEESKKKMAKWQIGRKMSDESKLKMSISAKQRIIQPWQDKTFSIDHRKKISKSLRGRTLSLSHKAKIQRSTYLRICNFDGSGIVLSSMGMST
jgi:group I intron endonuclease